MAMHLGEAEIKEGSQGLDVRKLQEILNGGGYSAGPIDGIFGPQTTAAVKSFQSAKKLISDGIVGPLTWNMLMGTAPPAPLPPTPTLPPAGRPGGSGMFAALGGSSTSMLVAFGAGVLLFFTMGKARR